MIITANDFQNNFNKYMAMVGSEELRITKDGVTIAEIVKPQKTAVDSLIGVLKDQDITDIKQVREERLARYYESND